MVDDPQTTDDTIEVGEATLAEVTMSAVLKGEMPRIGIGVQKKIVATDKRIDELARLFVADQLPKKLKVPNDFNYKKTLERFSKPISEAEISAIMKKFPPDASDTALSFLAVFQGAFAKLSEEFPTSTYETYLGPKNIQPTSDKWFDWRVFHYWIVDDPFVTFQLMQCGALQPEHVENLKEFYPSLYNYMIAATLNELVKRNLRDSSFVNLPPRADRGLATLKQQRIVDYGPNIHVAPPNEPKPQGAPPMRIDKGLQTQGQKVAAL